MAERIDFDPGREQQDRDTIRVDELRTRRAQAVTLNDFRSFMQSNHYIFMPTGDLWPGSRVNARVPDVGEITASRWLDSNRPVEQMTWCPGEPQVVPDRLVSDGGWIERPGCNVYNLYRAPLLLFGDPAKARPWLDHVRRVYPEDVDHIVQWLAHRVQRPAEKINHAIVMGGAQGVGKDTILEPVKAAVGPWNFKEVSPKQMLNRFNGFAKAVILRISEARDLGDVDRFAFYDHMKVYTAAPPDCLRVDEKNLREYDVFNVCGCIITTNHKTNGIHLPADDRRHYVAWSEADKEDFQPSYFDRLYEWFESGGTGHVAAYLRTLDLSGFKAKAPPPKTAAFWDIVAAGVAPEDGEMADALDALGRPDVVTIKQIIAVVQPISGPDGFKEWLLNRRNSRQIPYRLSENGYVSVRNEATKDGRWKVSGNNVVIYARRELSVRDQIAAARRLAGW